MKYASTRNPLSLLGKRHYLIDADIVLYIVKSAGCLNRGIGKQISDLRDAKDEWSILKAWKLAKNVT